MIFATEDHGFLSTHSTNLVPVLHAVDQGRTTTCTTARTTSTPRSGRSNPSAVTTITVIKPMTEPRLHDPSDTKTADIGSGNPEPLYGSSSSLGMSFLDIDASIQIHTDSFTSRAYHQNESEDSQEANTYGCADTSQLRRVCFHAQEKFEMEFSTSQFNDSSHTFPVFSESEIIMGHFLGRGSTGQVNQVCGFRIKKTNVGDQIDESSANDSAREFIVDNCYRDSGDARYAIKYIRKQSIKDPQGLQQSLAELNLETRFLSHLTANPHPNLIKLRAVGSGDRFSPNYFIILDRLYDTLDARLEKWIDKAKKLDCPKRRLKAMIARPSNNDEKRERSALLDDQLRAIAGLSSAIAHMHKHGLMHRDIKSTNMGFDNRDDIKLFDLALAREIPHTMDYDRKRTALEWKLTQMIGTPRCMAPEVALGWCYNERCDVFSFGMVMWQIMGLQMKTYGTARRRNNIQFFTKSVWQGAKLRPSMRFPKRTAHIHFIPQLQELVTLCWSHRWQDRPAMSTVEATIGDVMLSRTRSEKTVTNEVTEKDESLQYGSTHSSRGGTSSSIASSLPYLSPDTSLQKILRRGSQPSMEKETAVVRIEG